MDQEYKQREDETLDEYIQRLSDKLQLLEVDYRRKYLEESTKISNKKK